ncbi:MAG: ComEA family DNA-binding protein [Phormidesmis sp.]
MLKKFFTRNYHPLWRRLQQEPYYRFQSFEEMQLAASWGVRMDANTASVDEWLRLPGLSIHQARSLTNFTSQKVSFTCIEDIAAALNLPVQQIQPWQVILQFYYYDPEAALEPEKVNVNTATVTELTTVPTIDTFLARAIIYYRQASSYRDLADLQDRLRLTSKAAVELLHYLKF